MSNYLVGHGAEKRAAAYLRSLDFQILKLNWRTRYCEIDIVAMKDQTIHLIEVKYRRNTKQGSGVDYVNRKKLNRMVFAAEMWVSKHKWQGDYQLGVVSVDNHQCSYIDDLWI